MMNSSGIDHGLIPEEHVSNSVVLRIQRHRSTH